MQDRPWPRGVGFMPDHVLPPKHVYGALQVGYLEEQHRLVG
jgi:hypothetical protein